MRTTKAAASMNWKKNHIIYRGRNISRIIFKKVYPKIFDLQFSNCKPWTQAMDFNGDRTRYNQLMKNYQNVRYIFSVSFFYQ